MHAQCRHLLPQETKHMCQAKHAVAFAQSHIDYATVTIEQECLALCLSQTSGVRLPANSLRAGVDLPVVGEEDMETLAAQQLYSAAECAQLLQSAVVEKVTRSATR